MHTHDWIDERLEAYLDGDLSPEEVQRFEAALEGNGWDEELVLASAIRDGLRALPVPPCPPPVTAAVMAEVRRAERTAWRERVRRWLTAPFLADWRPALAMATLVAMVVTAALIGRPSPAERYADAEVERALAEVQWTLAYLSAFGRETSRSVRQDVLQPHVMQPMHDALSPLGTPHGAPRQQ